MVLRNSNNVSRRNACISENTPPNVIKAINVRLRKSSYTSSVTNRRRHLGTLGNTTLRQPKCQLEHSKKRQEIKDRIEQFNKKAARGPNGYYTFEISSNKPAPTEVDMTDSTDTSTLAHATLTFPRTLSRPPHAEVAYEALLAAGCDEKSHGYPGYARDIIASMGTRLLASLRNCQTQFASNNLPDEFLVLITDPANTMPPTHVMAVRSSKPPPPGTAPGRVKLFPVHALVLAAHCTRLPPFEMKAARHISDTQIIVPRRQISVPCPETFQHILAYLYTRRKSPFLNAMLPIPAPTTMDEPGAKAGFGALIGRMPFTTEGLMTYVMIIHGIWSNVIALGIFDDGLWDMLDTAWEIILTAMVVNRGQPELMIVGCKVTEADGSQTVLGPSLPKPKPLAASASQETLVDAESDSESQETRVNPSPQSQGKLPLHHPLLASRGSSILPSLSTLPAYKFSAFGKLQTPQPPITQNITSSI
ncbi:hypothetical protein D9611_011060 [Ephemerocybe angulata]|uniref:BTB domain-containing protein n=1 Tax=Ephemerocybe angulata TaxID=980116 RepID=A0A8H5BAX8_9AGAR|nr:hypothetical protein D9611_011060 [Tulosesus angulatus]